MNLHSHEAEWDKSWKDKSCKKRMIEFVRRNYFSKIFISEVLKNMQNGTQSNVTADTCVEEIISLTNNQVIEL